MARDRAGERAIREIAAVEDRGVVSLWRAGEREVRMPVRLMRKLR